MMDMFCKLDVKKTGIFAAGVLFGPAGIKVLSSKDANEGMRHEDGQYRLGKRGGYLCGSCPGE